MVEGNLGGKISGLRRKQRSILKCTAYHTAWQQHKMWLVLKKIPRPMLGSCACRAAGYCTESCLQNISATLCFAVDGKNPRRCYFFMKLWRTWLMFGTRLAAPYRGLWVAYLQIQGQIIRGAHSQLSKCSAAELQARLLAGPGIGTTEQELSSCGHPRLIGWFLS